jgi:CCR4-NOT transcriptional complex subunit CAF120
MTQWTAAIRLAMYEHTSLYEAYTGSLIAAKGKTLNGIQSILAPAKFKHEDWARVRFGAGTPWRRCWFVINPPDEKELQKARKVMKKSAYDRLTMPITGSIQFYETKKTKKVKPIATVTNVYSAYAIYPQSKALIDQSTLVKLEGRISMHSGNQPSTEGFVFVMPELHAAVSGFEMMLRFLFPTFDTFNLYGRPTRLVADVNHIKSIMFAFPKQRRYGYLDVLDITNLLQIPGSQDWSEAEWRKQLKDATQKRMSTGRSRTNSVNSSRPRYRASISSRPGESSLNGSRQHLPPLEAKPEFNQSAEAIIHEVPRNDPVIYHSRGMSDTTGLQTGPRPGYGSLLESSPDSSAQDLVQRDRAQALAGPIAERSSSESDRNSGMPERPSEIEEQLPPRTPPSPVTNPPTFAHGPREMPTNRPKTSHEQRLANNRMSHTTLMQFHQVGKTGMEMDGAALGYQDQHHHQQQRPEASM